MNWNTKAIALSYPIETGERVVREINVREPDVDALEAIEELGLAEGKRPTVKQLRGLIVALGDQPTEVIGKLHRADLGALGEAIVPLLGNEEKAEA